jgi:hypothetical protein
LIAHTFDPRPQLPQLVVETLVAAVEVVDVLDGGAAVGGEAGYQQRGASAKIAGGDPCAAETLDAGNGRRAPGDCPNFCVDENGTVPFDLPDDDASAQAVQLGRVQESAGEHAVFDATDSFAY